MYTIRLQIHDPGNKSEKFPQILQPRWFSLKNFWGISQESFPVIDSSEIFKKFPRIGPQDNRFFLESQFWDSVSENSWEILWNFSPQNSSEFFQNNSPDIPENFLGLSYHVYWFLGEFIKRISFKKFLGIFLEFYPKKILKISLDYFSGNFWETFMTWSPCLRSLRGI